MVTIYYTTAVIIITFVAGDEQYSNEARSLLVYLYIIYMYIHANVYNNSNDIVPRIYQTYYYTKICFIV